MKDTDITKDILPERYIIEGAKPDIQKAIQVLNNEGVVILRGVLPDDSVNQVVMRAEEFLSQPSVAGVWGYFRADYQKKVLLPTLLGSPVYDLIANEHIINLVESYMGAECILAETNLKADQGLNYIYFPLHSDFAVGWRKSIGEKSPITESLMQKPLGVGAAIYLHDTSEGAFTYCIGTHKLGAPYGQRLAEYPDNMKKEIIARKVRLDGKKGDIIIFDDRGFHGPDHPSKKDRTVILVDYFRTDILGYNQVTPLPIWSCDIGGLSEKQLRILGASGATFTIPFDNYKWSKISKTNSFRIIKFLIDNAFYAKHLKMKLKARLLK
ncbi:MAG: hypothetical protein CMM30_02900 [Rhodospirillaceae bacterium]|nr:hypothetical protein [Rhodospirillaceae bacterium]